MGKFRSIKLGVFNVTQFLKIFHQIIRFIVIGYVVWTKLYIKPVAIFVGALISCHD